MKQLLKCGGISFNEPSNMFTPGKTYELREDGTVIDDLGHPRFIGSDMTFIVKNTGSIGCQRVYYAYFESQDNL
jgi:hypothetical protein